MKTNKMNKVLIALDFDPTAQKISEVGFTLAQKLGAEVILLHVIVDLVTYSLTYLNMGPLQLDSVEELKVNSQNFLDKVKRHLGDETIQTVLKEGEFADMIMETAAEVDADIIVLGSRGSKRIEEIIMGSVTEAVLRKATIPVFVVPARNREV